MYTPTIAAALLAALPSAVNALGSTVVKNQCSYPVYLWSVESDITGSGPMHTINAGDSWSQEYLIPPIGGISMKIAREDHLSWTSSDQHITQFEYTVADMLYYDISNINGNPFTEGGLSIVPSESSCPSKVCPAGTKLCSDAYNTPTQNDAVGACSASSEVTMVLCSANGASNSNGAPAENVVAKAAVAAPAPAVSSKAPVPSAPAAPVAPAPTPATTAAPVAVPEPNGQVFTTFVTQVVTVEAKRDAMPTPPAEKADEMHAAMHKRSAHRHHFHRHEADAE